MVLTITVLILLPSCHIQGGDGGGHAIPPGLVPKNHGGHHPPPVKRKLILHLPNLAFNDHSLTGLASTLYLR